MAEAVLSTYPTSYTKQYRQKNNLNRVYTKKPEPKNHTGRNILIGLGGTAGFFFTDLFLAKGKILSGITRGRVSFIKTMSEEIDNVVKKDGYAIKNRLEAFFTVPGLHAVWAHRISHQLHKWNIPVLPRFLANISRMVTGIEIHPGAKIGKNLFIDHTGAIIGETAEIGNNVMIIGRAVLGSTGKDGFYRHTIVEDSVTIGMDAIMLGRIKLAKGSQIGAGAVVTHDVPEWATVIGNPAKIIRMYAQRLKQPILLGKEAPVAQ